MDKETKIFLAIVSGFVIYLVLKNNKFLQNKVVTSNLNTTTPNTVLAPITTNVKSPINFPKGLIVENIPIVKQTPFAQTPLIEKEPIIDYTNYKRPPSYKMTDAERAACQKNLKDCKF
jgi:hypothetical protein